MMPMFNVLTPAIAKSNYIALLRKLCGAALPQTQPCKTSEFTHTSVMPKEVLEALNPIDNGVYIDMTYGFGGHSRSILAAANNVKLYCLDRDPVAYECAKAFSKEYGNQVTALLGRFSELDLLMKEHGVAKNSVDGMLFDVGCSSMQFDDAERGFSLSKDGILDMRMDGNRFPDQLTAADVVNTLDYPSLVKIFKIYGEEKHSKKIAQALIDARFLLKTIKTTKELADVVLSAMGIEYRMDRLQRPAHVATKVFQALRIFVNNELNELNYGMELAYSYLKPGGRLVALTFHSLEDRIVKRHFHGINMDEPVSRTLSQKYNNAALWHDKETMDNVMKKRWITLYKTVIKPGNEEVKSNPRSRSAKLRFAVKIS